MKPRNYVALAMLKCKKQGGAHTKSTKAVRRKEKINLKKQLTDI